MTTRSGLSIKKVPLSSRSQLPIKYSPPDEQQVRKPTIKKHRHHGTRHKSLNYMSFVTRFQVSLRLSDDQISSPLNEFNKIIGENVLSTEMEPLTFVSSYENSCSDSSETDYNSESDSSVIDEAHIKDLDNDKGKNNNGTSKDNSNSKSPKDVVATRSHSKESGVKHNSENRLCLTRHDATENNTLLERANAALMGFHMAKSSLFSRTHMSNEDRIKIPVRHDDENTFSPNDSVIFHFEQGTNRVLPLKCEECDKEFLLVSAYTTHLRSHVKQKNKCQTCGKVFTRSWLLKGHMRTHTGERPFKCSTPGCDKAFADKSNLRSHMMIHSVTSKNHSCRKCGRSFAQKRYLHKHMLEVCRLAL